MLFSCMIIMQDSHETFGSQAITENDAQEEGQELFEFNPNRHVKIWLSKNPESFLNTVNQLRLIKMRVDNPSDEITFVFDSQLLNDNAMKDLHKFCSVHNFIPLDVREINRRDLPRIERKLFRIYDREINFANYGNPAAASDILRFLSPIYSRGIYSDFDTVIKTKDIGTISVNKPLLLSIGSVKLDSRIIQKMNLHEDVEEVKVNTDIIAIVDPIAARPLIEKIQQNLLVSCTPCSDYRNSYLHTIATVPIQALVRVGLDPKIMQNIAYNNLPPLYYIQKYAQEKLGRTLNVPQMREVIEYICLSRTKTAEFILFQRNVDLLSVREKYPQKKGRRFWDTVKQIAAMMIEPELKNEMNIDLANEILQSYRKKLYFNLMKESVVTTTGPAVVSMVLFEYFSTSIGIDTQIKPYSFQQYDLHKAFHSDNIFPFHTTHQEMQEILQNSTGFINDLSWLAQGEEHMLNKEEQLHDMATKIQNFGRMFRSSNQQQIKKLLHSLHRQIKSLDNDNSSDVTMLGILNELKDFILDNLVTKSFIDDETHEKFVELHKQAADILSDESEHLLQKICDFYTPKDSTQSTRDPDTSPKI